MRAVMERIAKALKMSLDLSNRLHEGMATSDINRHKDELSAMADNAINAIMNSSEDVVEGMIVKGRV